MKAISDTIFSHFFQARKSRIASNGPTDGENRHTKSALTLIITFFCCNILQSLLHFLDDEDKLLQNISLCLMTLNCSVNMIVRPVFGEKFRETFVGQYCSCINTTQTQHSINITRNL